MTTINFSVLDNKWINLLPNYKKIIKNTAKQAFSETNNHVNKKYEISFALLNDTLIKKLNFDYRSKDKATNVLSFPMIDKNSFEHENILGDIAISIDKILSESKEQNIKKDEYLAKISIHGILHLLGYDHVLDKDYEIMRKLEENIIKKVRK